MTFLWTADWLTLLHYSWSINSNKESVTKWKKKTLKGSSPSEKNSPLVEHNLKTYIATSFQKRWFHRVEGRELTASSSRPSRLKRATMAAHLAWVRAESSLELRDGTGVVRLTTLMKYSVHATTLLRYKVSNQSSLKNS